MMTKINPMTIALNEAEKAGKNGEIPVGAVVYSPKAKEVIAKAGNQVEAMQNPLYHAEMIAINEACKKLGIKTLDDLDIYVTLEPCSLCASAISLVRLKRLYFGAYDAKSGGVVHGAKIFQNKSCHFRPEVYGGIEEQRASSLIKDFFAKIRALKNE